MTVLTLEGIDLGEGRLQVDRLEFSEGRKTIVFGPNGAGKTTLLRLVAGTLRGGRAAAAAYLPQRPFAFRGSAQHNLALGLDDQATATAGKIAARLGVDRLLAQPAATLSGGERQRLALAATLARPEPAVLLDEPLAAIDARDRSDVAAVVSAAIGGRTAVVVTHDVETAVALGDEIIVLVDGRVRQRGQVAEVLSLPADETVAGVLGVSNLIVGSVTDADDSLVAVAGGPMKVWGIGSVEKGGAAAAMFSAEAVTVFAGDIEGAGSARNLWAGVVVEVRPLGRLLEVVVDAGQRVVAVLTPGSVDALDLSAGSAVSLAVKATAVRVVAA